MAAVHAHRQAQRQVGHGFFGLPNRKGYPKLQRPASGPTGTVWRRRGSGKAHCGDGRVRRASQNRAKRRGRTAAARDGSAAAVCAKCGGCTETCTVQPAARGSVRRGGALGTAWKRRCFDQPLAGVHATAAVRVPPVRPLCRTGKCTRQCVVVRCTAPVVGPCRTATSDGVRRGDAPRWPWPSRAPAGAKRAGRSIGRLLGV
jgi:hypothetical protein